MPSKSPAQAKLMRAVAHGWKKPGGGGPTRAVAREFVNADGRKKVQGYQFGGMAAGYAPRNRYAGMKPSGPLSNDPRGMPPPVGMAGPQRLQAGPQQMPQGGALRQMMQRMQQGQQGNPGGGTSGMMSQMRGDPRSMPPVGPGNYPPGKGPRPMVPPSRGYPGGGNPNIGGRNPMMRGRQRFNPMMGRGPTSQLR